DGSALGAALWRAACVDRICNLRSPVPFFGPAYPPEKIYEALGGFAELIQDGRVIAWYRGRMEFGPRALGHRSILADPGHPEMRDRINAMVKMREAFRPFAPAVSLEQVHDWFDVAPGTELPYMIMTVDVRKQHRVELPAVTHVNGS